MASWSLIIPLDLRLGFDPSIFTIHAGWLHGDFHPIVSNLRKNQQQNTSKLLTQAIWDHEVM